MLRKRFSLLLIFLALLSGTGGALPATSNDGRDADRAAIRAHIESICQAFIDGDIDKIYATHSEDWRGFLENTRVPIKGVDEYMRANGFQWPMPKGAAKPAPNPSGATRGFKVFDFDVHFYTPELAVACFYVDFGTKNGGELVTNTRYRIMDIYAKRKGGWIQTASHTVVDPRWRAEQMDKPRSLPPQARERILSAREAVWRAYFANDRAALEKLIPEEAIAINDGSEAWANREAIFAGARRFAESGAKLVRLEFPKTEMQIYGNTVIIYTTYLYEVEKDGKRTTSTGRGTEMFVQRGNTLVNVGWHLDASK